MEVISIIYEHGIMKIDLDEFMAMHNVSKVRKLIKFIRNSSTWECEDSIKRFLEEKLGEFNESRSRCTLRIADCTKKIAERERQLDQSRKMYMWGLYRLDRLKEIRDTHKKGTNIWKKRNEEVKEWNESKVKMYKSQLGNDKNHLKSAKQDLRYYVSQEKKITSDIEFYKKVLTAINDL